ncbi:hypothetical protein KIP88_42290 [Bradyrhizobium sp. SRL28]|uniref:hypothetical protein n=1 Tax=Bradyrhizobium sp. SRL28 TaxID=2836178 RepID=UPI001BDE2FDC|nr:hypothetical protein [Bradyrhizobium sp. SRL28]MBT1517011.1 hypothetical protein [Bradyrhizobium sp. SRL28]
MFPIHSTFPNEMAVIGRLLLDYGELELDLMNCVQVARKYDMNSTLKAMFRIRGEMSRIQIADALGRVALRYSREIVLLKPFRPQQLGRVFRIRGDCVLADRARALCEQFSEGVGRVLRVCLRAPIVGFNDALRQQSQVTSVLRASRLGFLAHRQPSLERG